MSRPKGSKNGIRAPRIPKPTKKVAEVNPQELIRQQLEAMIVNEELPLGDRKQAMEALLSLQPVQPDDDDPFYDPFACDKCGKSPCVCPETVQERAARLQRQQEANAKATQEREERLQVERAENARKEALRAHHRELLASGDVEMAKAAEVVLRRIGGWVDSPKLVGPPQDLPRAQSGPLVDYPKPERTVWDDPSVKREAETMRSQQRNANVINWLTTVEKDPWSL